MKEPSKKDTQVVWSGNLAAPQPQRAEILEPSSDGNYAVTGYGGQAEMPRPQPQPAPPPSKPAPKRKAPARAKAPAKAKAKPKAKSHPTPPNTPEAQSRVLAETVVGSMVERLKAEAMRKGGMLALDDIERLSDDFQQKTVALQGVFQKSFEEYVKARERASWEQARQYPFDRILVKSFSHLFADGTKLVTDANVLSRRVLPGFFMALGMMLGPDVLEGYQERCRAVVKRHKERESDRFSWEEVYEDTKAKEVVLDALVAVAPYFDDLQRRVPWFINMVNSHLSPYEGNADSPAAHWAMTGVSFHALLDALFADLKTALNSKAGNKALMDRHGEETCADLYDVLRRLEGAAKAARNG